MVEICEGITWVVWLDYQGKWHSSDYGWFRSPLSDEGARQFAKILIGDTEGTSDLVRTAQAVYCTHAKSRYQAIKMAKEAYKTKLLKKEGG